jgi:hypothetical protein
MGYNFSEINNFIVSATNAESVFADGELLAKHKPDAKILQELKKANQFNSEKIDGSLLMELVKYESFDGILSNRKYHIVESDKMVKTTVNESIKQKPTEKKKGLRKKNIPE